MKTADRRMTEIGNCGVKQARLPKADLAGPTPRRSHAKAPLISGPFYCL